MNCRPCGLSPRSGRKIAAPGVSPGTGRQEIPSALLKACAQPPAAERTRRILRVLSFIPWGPRVANSVARLSGLPLISTAYHLAYARGCIFFRALRVQRARRPLHPSRPGSKLSPPHRIHPGYSCNRVYANTSPDHRFGAGNSGGEKITGPELSANHYAVSGRQSSPGLAGDSR